ncbi:unnamed protein product, partial [Sphacelaria rigidula]
CLQDCRTTACKVCVESGVRGGAMKKVRRSGADEQEWVHVSCALWIPEVR